MTEKVSCVLALMGAVSSAQASTMEARWEQIVSAAPASCRVAADAAAVRIDCGGTALLLEATDSERDPRRAALERQLAPFRGTPGVTIRPPMERACTVEGVMVDCLSVEVQVQGGGSIEMTSARPPHAGWVGTCLRRGSAPAAVCEPVFLLEPH